MKNFRTYHLSVAFYRSAIAVPLPSHLADQLKRAASSVVLNLAEGVGRETPPDQRRFYRIAFGSIKECQALLDLANGNKQIIELADKIAAHLYRLILSKRG